MGEVGLTNPALPDQVFHVTCALDLAMEIMQSGLLIAGEYQAYVRTASDDERLNAPTTRD